MATAPVRLHEKVLPFPWEALECVPREVVTILPVIRRALRRAFDERAFASSLGELVDASVRLATWEVEVREGPDLPALHGAAFVLETSDARLRMGVELERDLAASFVGKLLRRPAPFLDPSRPLEAPVVGATAALVTRAARSSHDVCLVPAGMGALRVEPGERVLCLHLTVLVNDEAYAAKVTLPLPAPTSLRDPDVRTELSRLHTLPLELPLVVAVSTSTRAELASLRPGDVWLAGEGWTIRREGSVLVGEALLMAASSERGLGIELGEDGSLVVKDSRTSAWEVQAMSEIESDADAKTMAEAVLDAPVVVRVEMGSVTLTAKEWAGLAAGDVIAMGKRVAEPVVLRVAGVEVARGELVDIEGELGVRILETDRG